MKLPTRFKTTDIELLQSGYGIKTGTESSPDTHNAGRKLWFIRLMSSSFNGVF
jgi:hypothetical protein